MQFRGASKCTRPIWIRSAHLHAGRRQPSTRRIEKVGLAKALDPMPGIGQRNKPCRRGRPHTRLQSYRYTTPLPVPAHRAGGGVGSRPLDRFISFDIVEATTRNRRATARHKSASSIVPTIACGDCCPKVSPCLPPCSMCTMNRIGTKRETPDLHCNQIIVCSSASLEFGVLRIAMIACPRIKSCTRF